MRLYTTIAKLLEAKRFFAENPQGRIQVDWCTSWNKRGFEYWFMRCLHEKINRNEKCAWRKAQPEYMGKMTHDARMINDYTARRIRHTGCRNLLRTPEMKDRYPHINNQVRED